MLAEVLERRAPAWYVDFEDAVHAALGPVAREAFIAVLLHPWARPALLPLITILALVDAPALLPVALDLASAMRQADHAGSARLPAPLGLDALQLAIEWTTRRLEVHELPWTAVFLAVAHVLAAQPECRDAVLRWLWRLPSSVVESEGGLRALVLSGLLEPWLWHARHARFEPIAYSAAEFAGGGALEAEERGDSAASGLRSSRADAERTEFAARSDENDAPLDRAFDHRAPPVVWEGYREALWMVRALGSVPLAGGLGERVVYPRRPDLDEDLAASLLRTNDSGLPSASEDESEGPRARFAPGRFGLSAHRPSFETWAAVAPENGDARLTGRFESAGMDDVFEALATLAHRWERRRRVLLWRTVARRKSPGS